MSNYGNLKSMKHILQLFVGLRRLVWESHAVLSAFSGRALQLCSLKLADFLSTHALLKFIYVYVFKKTIYVSVSHWVTPHNRLVLNSPMFCYNALFLLPQTASNWVRPFLSLVRLNLFPIE